ncbi:MAG: tRNA uracil 4-sulfurtransferase ThiI [Planctomycetota bacterium]|nr:tRNA uracil 4-sulfurtransferase ThiI [Planctomycetota bacterium]
MSLSEKKQSDSAPSLLAARHLLINYDEIALKGGNRRYFENRLQKNIRSALKDLGGSHLKPRFGRFLLRLGNETSLERVCSRLARIPGIALFSPCISSSADLDSVKSAMDKVLEPLLERGEEPDHFAVVSRRANKELPFTSTEANEIIGKYVQDKTGWKVRLKKPQLPLYLFFVNNDCFLALDRVRGQGGLPTGTTGKVACLLSGGIDSPVSTARIMKRGADAVFIHFHSHPHTTLASQEKVRDLAEQIVPPGHRVRLYMVPFAPTQNRIITECPARLRVILYRRYMVRAAEAIAHQEGAHALVTGDSLGQVASQTLENLHTINTIATLPILRPLVGMHKAEIIRDAQLLGSFETSIEPHDDCCSYLMPPKPATRSTPEQLEAAEKNLDTESEIQELVENSTVEIIDGRLD